MIVFINTRAGLEPRDQGTPHRRFQNVEKRLEAVGVERVFYRRSNKLARALSNGDGRQRRAREDTIVGSPK